MATVMSSATFTFETDFYILNVVQKGANFGGTAGFAVSFAGGVSGLCGSKYASVSARLERWSEVPPLDNTWEDFDDLPFVAIKGGGPLRAQGFDEVESESGLSMDDFDGGRVRVLARGRYAADPSSERSDEEWLFQFYPEEGSPRPLAGGPRRLAGPGPFVYLPEAGWMAALHSWHVTGWHGYLSSTAGFESVHRALSSLKRPATARDIADAVIPNTNRPSPPMPSSEHLDVIEALCALQLLLPMQQDDETLLVVNPAPGFVWDRVALEDAHVDALRLRIAQSEFETIATVIAVAVEWAGADGLSATVRQLATRWSTTVRDIRGGIALCETLGRIESITVESFPGDDVPIRLRLQQ